jgi:hypothetical protein
MRRLLRAMTQNWQLKLMACALAVLLWVVVSAEQVMSSWISIPLEVQETDPEYQLLRESVPDEVRVRFVGPGREFFDLAVRRPPLSLVVDEVGEADQVFDLEPSMIRLPNELDVSPQDVDPGRVRLRFRRMATRVLPVRVAVTGGPGPGFAVVDSLQVRPQQIRVSGPAERVGELQSVSTVPITIPPGDSLFSRVVAIDTVGLEGLERSAERVRVAAQVESVVERRLRDLRVSVGPGITIRPAQVGVRLRGPRSRVLSVEPQNIRVVMAIDSIPAQVPPGGAAVPLRLQGLPPGVQGTLEPRAVRLLSAVPLLLDTVPVGASRAPRQEGPPQDEPAGE